MCDIIKKTYNNKLLIVNMHTRNIYITQKKNLLWCANTDCALFWPLHLFISTLCQQGPREVVLWLSVLHKEKKALEIFSREVAPAGTGMGKHTCVYCCSSENP